MSTQKTITIPADSEWHTLPSDAIAASTRTFGVDLDERVDAEFKTLSIRVRVFAGLTLR
jgi:hypothetical protein